MNNDIEYTTNNLFDYFLKISFMKKYKFVIYFLEIVKFQIQCYKIS